MGEPATRRPIDLPTGRIDYRELGPADGPPVVLVHGFLVDDGVWADVPERLAARGLRVLAPTLPLGAHRTPAAADADLSPRGIARIVLSFLEALDLHDVTLVGNDTGGAICQFVLDEDASRVGRLVLTNCDAFEVFPPFPFDLLLRLARHPGPTRVALAATRWARFRTGPFGFGALVARRPTAAETLPWITPYLTDPGVRRDVARFARAWRPADLAAVGGRLAAFDRPVLLCWAPRDRFFRIGLAHRLRDAFPDARLVEVDQARTFLALDQPGRLAGEIAGFVPAAQVEAPDRHPASGRG
ncbi:alpha/beta fold hydrolase [Pseudonocardia humida]|uniref:Alpha/beta fold hydrolase n=1 Tax=Pseudonocardia humida TaxID=2800819 RepID=A0ABT0ZT46_9PSEU|nr:alpha/beta fold hydrolase [Pseudonocardia humida]MCO1653896.1 alpha/beta fold hydrolase [Pseudonocardia humida]